MIQRMFFVHPLSKIRACSSLEATMQIQVNGEERVIQDHETIASLLHTLGVRSDQVAVEVNLRIVDRQEFPVHQLHEGDQVEIMSFIGGGRV